MELQIRTLSAALHKEPAFRKLEPDREEARKRDNALYLADAITSAHAYRIFLVNYITQHAATETAGLSIPLVKEIDAALESSLISRASALSMKKLISPFERPGCEMISSPCLAPRLRPRLKKQTRSQSLQLSTTDKNKFLVEGDLEDVVLLFNASPTAPHVAKNLRGEIVFEGDKADVCLFQRTNSSDALANNVRIALGSLQRKNVLH